jgi:hypothetical protein
MRNTQINDYSYTQEGYENFITGSEELMAYWHEVSLPRVDTKMDPSYKYEQVRHPSPPIWNAKAFSSNKNFESRIGGPWYIELGVERTYQIQTGNSTTDYLYHDYLPSSVEFYEYKKETVKSIRPTRGLSTGGTNVEVVGLDFRYMPEYGLVPHCKFGDKIVRAKFDSNVRIVC